MAMTASSRAPRRILSTHKPLCEASCEKLIHRPVTSGPWGGEGGHCWDDGVYTAIRQIIVRSGNAIDFIEIEYDRGGESVRSARHGGKGGFNTDKIQLDYPNEALIYITGHHGSFYPGGPRAIRSLAFYTNIRKYGPYGVEEGRAFTSATSGSKIVGFHGRHGIYLDALGVYAHLFVNCELQCPASTLLPRIIYAVRDIVEAVKVSPAERDTSPTQVQKRAPPTPVPAGPWGGQGGIPWDDGLLNGIRQIVLRVGDVIDCVSVEYQRNGRTFWSRRHGGIGGVQTHSVRLDYPDEYLKRITGFYGRFSTHNSVVVRSLRFHSNRRTYGPFGVEDGTPFSSPSNGRKILGFHGRSGWYLDAIGVQLVMDQTEETNEDHVQNTWVEFVSRVIHQKILEENDNTQI